MLKKQAVKKQKVQNQTEAVARQILCDLLKQQSQKKVVSIQDKFTIIPIQPDGNCFYNAVSYFVGEDHRQIRRKVIDYFLSEDLKPMRQTFDIKQKQIRQLKKDGVWNNDAGDYIPELFAKLYKVRLRIYNKQGKLISSMGEKGKLYNLMLANDHYSVLTQKKKS